jgi:hypothetical protein
METSEMMLIVVYDLHPAPGRDYSIIEDAVKSCGSWAHLQGSVWVIDTLEKPKAVTERLIAVGHPHDSFFVAQLEESWWSKRLSGQVLSWLKGPRRW